MPTNKNILSSNLYMLNYRAQILLSVLGLQESVCEEPLFHKPDSRGIFVYRCARLSLGGHLPIDEKLSLPLCDLSASAVNPDFEINSSSPKKHH